jgi:hypothetical protein
VLLVLAVSIVSSLPQRHGASVDAAQVLPELC